MLLPVIFLTLSSTVFCDINSFANKMFPSYDNFGNNNTEIICPDFAAITNGNVMIQKLDSNRKVATITCDHGYDIEGNSNIYCIDGQWGYYTLPQCIKRCLPPPYLKNGALEIEAEKDEEGYYPKGTVASYSCIGGYELTPATSNLRVCEKGIWTGPAARCVPKVIQIEGCETPKPIDNGYFMQEKSEGLPGYNAFGQRVHYYCKPGYLLQGPRVQQCLEDTSWSPKVQPICELKEAPTTSSATANGDFFSMTTSAADSTTTNANMWSTNGFSTTANAFQQPSTQTFGATNDLTGLFNSNEPSVFDPLSDQNKSAPVIPQPVSVQPQRPPPPSKILTGDLESSLNSLVENLTIDTGSRSSQWNSPKNQPKTSTAGGWQPQPIAATTAASYRPMMGQQPVMQPMMNNQSMMGGQPVMQPMMAPMQYPMGNVQQPVMGSPKLGTALPAKQEVSFDPFGAL